MTRSVGVAGETAVATPPSTDHTALPSVAVPSDDASGAASTAVRDGASAPVLRLRGAANGMPSVWLLAGPYDRPQIALEAAFGDDFLPGPGHPATDDPPSLWRWKNAPEGVVYFDDSSDAPASAPTVSPEVAGAGASASRPPLAGMDGTSPSGTHYFYAFTPVSVAGPDVADVMLVVNADTPFRLWAANAKEASSPLPNQFGIHMAVASVPVLRANRAMNVLLRVAWPAEKSARGEFPEIAAACLKKTTPPPTAPTSSPFQPVPDVTVLFPATPVYASVRDAVAREIARRLTVEASPGSVDATERVSVHARLAPAGLPMDGMVLTARPGTWVPTGPASVPLTLSSSYAGTAWVASLNYAVPAPPSAALAEKGIDDLRVAVESADTVWAEASATVASAARVEARLREVEAGLDRARRAYLAEHFRVNPADAALVDALDILTRAWLPESPTVSPDAAASARLAVEQVRLIGPSRNAFAFAAPSAGRWAAWARGLDAVFDAPSEADAPRANDVSDGPAIENRPSFAPEKKAAVLPRAGIHEGAYRSRIDGSTQPYRYILPAVAPTAAAGSVPLIVMLHGYVPSYNKATWIDLDLSTAGAMDALGAAMVWPFGRGNTDFLSIGEEDVLRVVEDLLGRYPCLDPDRVYLCGYSMGGSGVWTGAAHYPGRWAAARAWSGRNDWFYWQSETLARAGLHRDNFPDFKKYLVLVDNPYDLTENLARLPFEVIHPHDDYYVKPGQASRIFEKLAPPRGRMTLDMPERGGHFYFAQQMDVPSTWRSLLAHRRDRDPAFVDLVAYTPKYGRHGGVAITALRRWGERARLTVRRVEENGATVFVVERAENVRSFVLRWPGEEAVAVARGLDGFDPSAAFRTGEDFRSAVVAAAPNRTVRVRFVDPATDAAFGPVRVRKMANDPADGGAPFAAAFELTLREFDLSPSLPDTEPDGARPSLPRKALRVDTPFRAEQAAGAFGPVKEAFNQRFVLVLGTGGTPGEQAANRKNLERFQHDWKTFAHADAPTLTDRELLSLFAARQAAVRRAAESSAASGADADRLGGTAKPSSPVSPAAEAMERRWTKALSCTFVCFGRPSTHAYLATLADRLPFRFFDGDDPQGPGYGVVDAAGGVASAHGGDLGFLALYPRPPTRAADPRDVPSYVVIFDGAYYAERQSFNHKWDLAPDFLVFAPRQTAYDGNNVASLAGFFDTDWQVDPSLIWTFPDAPARSPSPTPPPGFGDAD